MGRIERNRPSRSKENLKPKLKGSSEKGGGNEKTLNHKKTVTVCWIVRTGVKKKKRLTRRSQGQVSTPKNAKANFKNRTVRA